MTKKPPMRSRHLALALSLVFVGCSTGGVATGNRDAAVAEIAIRDAGDVADGAPRSDVLSDVLPDTVNDAGRVVADGATLDTTAINVPDAEVPDAQAPDAEVPDAGMPLRIRLDNIEQRKRAIRRLVAHQPLPTNANGKHVHDHIAVKLYDGVQDSDIEQRVTKTAPSDNTFSIFTLSLLSAMAFVDWTTTTQQLVRERLQTYTAKDLLGGGTENHVVMRRAASVLFAETLPGEALGFGIQARDLLPIARQFMRDYGRGLFSYAMSEYLSPTYLAVSTSVWTNLYTYAKDAEVRFLAEAILDYLFTDLAINQLENTTIPARRYKDVLWDHLQTSVPYTGTQWISWLYFGSDRGLLTNGELPPAIAPTKPKNRNPLLHAINGYVPNATIRSLAIRSALGAYRVRQTKGSFYCLHAFFGNAHWQPTTKPCDPQHNLRDVFVHPDYIVGNTYFKDITSDATEITSDHIGLAWRTTAQQNSIRIAHPFFFYNLPIEEGKSDVWGDEDWAGASPFRYGAARDNVYLAVYDIPATDPYQGVPVGGPSYRAYRADTVPQDVYVYVPSHVTLQATADGRYLFEDGNTLGMIRPFDPLRATLLGASQHQGYQRIRLEGPLTGTYVMLASKSDFVSLAVFDAHTKKASFRTAELSSNKTVSYSHPDERNGETFSVAVPSDGSLMPLVKEGSQPLNYQSWPRWQSPYAQLDSNLLRAHNGAGGFEIDWSGDLPVYRYFELDSLGARRYFKERYFEKGAVKERSL